jgi:hypothetical protein
LDHRGTEALLVRAQQLQEALGLRTAPDHATLRWFGRHHVKPRLLADAGDDSEANHCWWREDLGIESIIPPIAGRPARGLTRRPYRRQLPLAFPCTAYGQRWKIETRISVVKRWFGGALTTRRYWQQVKQTLLRGVTYNLYRAVQLGLLIHLVSQRFVKAAV